jgi:adenosylhomocysteine nucleosidase
MTLAILSALAQEQSGLRAALQGAERVQHAGREFWRGRLYGHEVVLALSRIGKVAAATTATALIERLGARRILFTGVAGGLGRQPQVAVGHVVVAREFLQHDLDASPLFPRHEVPLYGKSRFATDAALTGSLLQAAHATGAVVHSGLVLSGDRFVSSALESRALQQALPDALAVEMEGAAVAQVCFDYGVPFCAMRSISDRADDDAHVDFGRFIDDVASKTADAVVQRWLALLAPGSTGSTG